MYSSLFLVIVVDGRKKASRYMSGAFFLSGHNAGHQGKLREVEEVDDF
jgi:hypothetical protein